MGVGEYPGGNYRLFTLGRLHYLDINYRSIFLVVIVDNIWYNIRVICHLGEDYEA